MLRIFNKYNKLNLNNQYNRIINSINLNYTIELNIIMKPALHVEAAVL